MVMPRAVRILIGRRFVQHLVGGTAALKAIMLLCLVWLAGACSRARGAAAIAAPCLHIHAAKGEDYRLGYGGQPCDQMPYADLPLSRYDDVAGWAYAAKYGGILPPLDEFRIVARLATLDARKAHGFNFENGFWRRYAWSDWAKQADAIAADALKNDSLVNALIEMPLSEARLGGGHGLDLELRATSLTRGVAGRLGRIFANAETRLQSVESMLVTPHTLEDVVKAYPKYAEQNRAGLTRYSIVKP